jgi:lysophospholipase L1-like esterase
MRDHTQKRILIFSLTLNLFFLILFGIHVVKNGGIPYLMEKIGFKSSSLKIFPNRLYKYEYYFERISLFESLPREKDEIIFIGNSLTSGCEWSELFQNPKIKNRGIAGDNIDGVLKRIDNVLKSKPKKIFISIGINDLDRDIPTQLLIKKYKQIIEKIRIGSPITQIYVQSILPVEEGVYETPITNDIIREFNSKLVTICKEKQVSYIDLFSAFIDKNHILGNIYSGDGVHLLGEGYIVWKSLIEKYVN